MNVLIIEDNQDIAASICDYLKSLDYAVDVADAGEAGLHMALTKHYAVIILNLGLPDIDGYRICRRLRQEEQCSVPIIMLTARDSLDSKLEAFNSGVDDYLIKPFALRELGARVKVLSGRVKS